MPATDLPFDITRLRTTSAGIDRIRRNLLLELPTEPLDYCRKLILDEQASITRCGKNWYVTSRGAILTINSSTLTIITAHRLK